MRFLCDVHISYKIVAHLKSLGYEAIHVNEILNKSETKDSDICKYADSNELIVLTKDADFRNSHFIKRTPKKLIKINLWNISNKDLINIISKIIGAIRDISNKPVFLIEIDKGIMSLIEI